MLNYFSRLFKGRLNNDSYQVGYAIFIGNIILMGIILILSQPWLDMIKKTQQGDFLVTNGVSLWVIINFFYIYSLGIRRSHDLGKSGWWRFGSPYFYGDADKHTNKYGKPPKPGIDFKSIFGFGQ